MLLQNPLISLNYILYNTVHRLVPKMPRKIQFPVVSATSPDFKAFRVNIVRQPEIMLFWKFLPIFNHLVEISYIISFFFYIFQLNPIEIFSETRLHEILLFATCNLRDLHD